MQGEEERCAGCKEVRLIAGYCDEDGAPFCQSCWTKHVVACEVCRNAQDPEPVTRPPEVDPIITVLYTALKAQKPQADYESEEELDECIRLRDETLLHAEDRFPYLKQL